MFDNSLDIKGRVPSVYFYYLTLFTLVLIIQVTNAGRHHLEHSSLEVIKTLLAEEGIASGDHERYYLEEKPYRPSHHHHNGVKGWNTNQNFNAHDTTRPKQYHHIQTHDGSVNSDKKKKFRPRSPWSTKPMKLKKKWPKNARFHRGVTPVENNLQENLDDVTKTNLDEDNIEKQNILSPQNDKQNELNNNNLHESETQIEDPPGANGNKTTPKELNETKVVNDDIVNQEEESTLSPTGTETETIAATEMVIIEETTKMFEAEVLNYTILPELVDMRHKKTRKPRDTTTERLSIIETSPLTNLQNDEHV